jgi:hypothetical protein
MNSQHYTHRSSLSLSLFIVWIYHPAPSCFPGGLYFGVYTSGGPRALHYILPFSRGYGSLKRGREREGGREGGRIEGVKGWTEEWMDL